MLHKFYAIILSLLLSNILVNAKNTVTIKGRVVEKTTQNALPFANVIIHTKTNQILCGTTTTDDGSFVLEKPSPSDCYLKVSYIGYNDTLVTIPGNEGDLNLGILELSSNQQILKSASITARKPLIEQKLDKIVMNVAEVVSTEGSNLLDLIKKAPGVSVDPSGNITLNGANVQVLIDGRATHVTGADLESLLTGTEGSSVDKIEIISQPSSKYDASGSGGIINIKTKRNFAMGINGSIRGSYMAAPYKHGYYDGYDAATILSLRNNKTNSTISMSQRDYDGFNTFDTETLMSDGYRTISKTFMNRPSKGTNIKLSADYHIDQNNIVGFVIGGMWRKYNDFTDESTGNSLYLGNQLVQTTTSIINNSYNHDNYSANLNYSHIFSNQAEVTMNADYLLYESGRASYQQNNYQDPDNAMGRDTTIFKIDAGQKINIISYKADYEQDLFKEGKIEAGFKTAQTKTGNDLKWHDKIEQGWSLNQSNSSLFDYQEYISAAYISIGAKLTRKLSIKGGIRAELTNSRGEWYSADTTTKKSYLDLFPTMHLSYTPNSKLRLGLSYSSRIERPGFEELNPQKFFIDATSAAVGNPELMPQYSNQATISLGYGQHFNFAVNGLNVKQVIVQVPLFESGKEEKTILWDNFGEVNIAGLNISINEFPITKWFLINTNVNTSYRESKHIGYYNNSIVTSANYNMTFLCPYDIKAEFSGWYQSKAPYGFFTLKPRSETTIGIKKGLIHNKAILSIVINDIFKTNKSKVSFDKNPGVNQDIESYKFKSEYRSHRITISFQYRFGKGKTYKQRNVANIEEASRVNTGN